MPSFAYPHTAQTVEPRYLLSLTFSAPSAVTVRFADGTIIDSTINASGSSVGEVADLVRGSVNQSDLASGQLVIGFPNRKIVVGSTIFNRISDMMATFEFSGVAAVLTRYVRALSGTLQEKRTVGTFQVTNITTITPDSFAMVLERYEPHRTGLIPKTKVGGVGDAFADFTAKDVIPEFSRGRPFPLRLGPEVWVPERMGGILTEAQVRSLIPVAGGEHQVMPAVLRADLTKVAGWSDPRNRVWSTQEQTGLGFQSWAHAQSGSAAAAYQYIEELGTFAEFRDSTVYTGVYGCDAAIYDRQRRRLRCFVVPKAQNELFPNTVDGWGRCVDGRLDTWLELLAGQSIRLSLPLNRLPSKIRNENGAISLRLFLIQNPGGGAPSGSGTLSVQIRGSRITDTTYWAQLQQPATINVASVGTGWVTVTRFDGLVYPQWQGGWRATHWIENGDFSFSSSNEEWEANLYGGEEYAGQPFDIYLSQAGPNTRSYILAVALVCNCDPDPRMEYNRFGGTIGVFK